MRFRPRAAQSGNSNYRKEAKVMSSHLTGLTRSILAGFIYAVFVASLWTAIYVLMGLSLVSATIAALAAALVRAGLYGVEAHNPPSRR